MHGWIRGLSYKSHVFLSAGWGGACRAGAEGNGQGYPVTMPATQKKFQEAGREQESVFAPVERRWLRRMAQATPGWINSDHLTLLGLVSMFSAGLCYWMARGNKYMLLAVIVCLAANWVGDSLDGTLARVRNRQRPRYGFYVDHITDAFGTLFLVGGMGLSGYMSPTVAAALLIVYFMLSIQAYLAAYALGTFQLSYWKFSPTELRVLLALGNLALLRWPMGQLFGYRFPLFDAGGVVGILGMSLMLIVSSIRNTAALYREERLPPG
jgi:phosphatidylglycerophosphate synthase